MTENQNKIIELVKQTKALIFQEMTHEKVTEKGAAPKWLFIKVWRRSEKNL